MNHPNLPKLTVRGYAVDQSGQIVADITALPVPLLDPWGRSLSTQAFAPIERAGRQVGFGFGTRAPNGTRAEVAIFDR
jgi:hypothetical protein